MLVLLSAFYSGLLLFFTIGLFRFKKNKNSTDFKPISIIIAARNEERNIGNLLQCLTRQNYPSDKYEMIIADDRSTDKTAAILESFQTKYSHIKTVKITHELPTLIGKKNALTAAIQLAQYDILAFTDADCLPSSNWLKEINQHFTDEIDFIAGYSPLLIKPKGLCFLKNLERASIFALTAGSFGWNWKITCTARNLAYRKKIFQNVNGFAGIGHLKSGDDDLMLQKLAPVCRKVNFMFSQDSFVPSVDNKNAAEQIHLETRRASKWKYYPVVIQIITLLTFSYYLLLGKITIQSIFQKKWKMLIPVHGVKIVSEFFLLSVFLAKIKQKKWLVAFPLAELIYIPYFIFFAIKGTCGNYKWKN
jgi:glycosyltransferase involved in cell wall biosynthesis